MKFIKIVIYLCLFLFMSQRGFAFDGDNLLPRCSEYDLCGYIDKRIWESASKEVFVLEPLFEEVSHFSGGLAAVRIKGKFGYIDHTGRVVIGPQFDQAGWFKKGLAIVERGKKKGVINKKGELIVDYIFTSASVFSNEVLIARERKYGAFAFGLFHISKGWLTDQSYKFETFNDPKFEHIWAIPFVENSVKFQNRKIGLMHVDGSWVLEPQFLALGKLNNGIAIVHKRVKGRKIYGTIDRDGRQIIPFQYEILSHFDSPYLKETFGHHGNRTFGIVSPKGELLAGRYFDEIKRPENVYYRQKKQVDFYMVRDGDVWKSLTKDGRLLEDQQIGRVKLECKNYTITYTLRGYRVTPQNSNLPKIEFDEFSNRFEYPSCDRPQLLLKGMKQGYLREDGSIFVGFFEDTFGFFGPNLWVRQDDLWGAIDEDGQFAIEPIFETIETDYDLPKTKIDTSSANARIENFNVRQGDRFLRIHYFDDQYHIDSFDEIEMTRAASLFCRYGLELKSKNGLWGIVRANGEVVIPHSYRAISCFRDGVVWVPDDIKRQWCPLGADNRIQSDPPCRTTYYSIQGFFDNPVKLDDDPYESSVLWRRAYLDYAEGRREEGPKFVPWD